MSTLIKPVAAPLAALLAAAVLAGCGSSESGEAQEGQFVKVGPVVYQVQLTRLVNPEQRSDKQLLRGQVPLPPSQQYLAVFMRLENKSSKPYLPPRDMKVVDTVGNQYLPLDATQSGFCLDFFRRPRGLTEVQWSCSGSRHSQRPTTCRSSWRCRAEASRPSTSSSTSRGDRPGQATRPAGGLAFLVGLARKAECGPDQNRKRANDG